MSSVLEDTQQTVESERLVWTHKHTAEHTITQ